MTTVNLSDYFKVEVATDRLTASLYITDQYDREKVTVTAELLKSFLETNNIVYGIQPEAIKQVITQPQKHEFPIVIAKGIQPIAGKDGYLTYHINISDEVERSSNNDLSFRDILRIPTVEKGDKLATLFPPTKGKDGRNVFGKTIPCVQ